ncbi:helix-turn-helix transcriptional regulator [Xanthobacter sediminis]|uniref:helix-turn-helix transcriptional regulator n=1 Tax=Xanthobacter sediminis TaxID=3119926 RepID=UPI00372BE5F2
MTRAAVPVGTEPFAPLRFSTKGIPPRDQFEAWRCFVGATAEVSLVEPQRVGFAADMEVWDLGSMAFVRAALPGAGFRRRYRNLRRAALDHWCLLLTGRPGTGLGAPFAPGSRHLRMRHLGRSFDQASDDSSMLLVYICRDLFTREAGALDAIPGHVPETAFSGIVSDYLVALSRHMGGLSRSDLPGLVDSTRALLVAWVSADGDSRAAAAGAIELTLRERVRAHVAGRLLSPALTPDSICQAVGVSRSRLYRLFEDIGGVAAYIRSQRLHAAMGRLRDPLPHGTVATIAEDYGFPDPSSFARAFRREFGMSPSDAREAARAGHVPEPRTAAPRVEGAADLGRLLRALRL